MSRYIADVRFICSIYPGKLEAVRRNYGRSLDNEGRGAERSTLFKLEPVPRGGKPFILPVYDSFESVIDVMAMSTIGGTPQKRRAPKPVPVETIISDLLNCWTGGLFDVPSGAKPGIGEISLLPAQVRELNKTGELPEDIGVAKEELDQLNSQQTLYFEYLFTEGERLHKQNNWKEITETMRLAADWLGYQREWSHKAIARDSGPCPLCTAIIPNAAVVCPSCHHVIKQLPGDIARLNTRPAA